MRTSKRLLSLLLAFAMLVSVFTVIASAAVNYIYTGKLEEDCINFKYTVEKVSTVPATDAGSEEYTADNIYAVTVWAQCDDPITSLTMPVHFNTEHFAPIVLVSEGTTYPYGAGLTEDSYYTDMGEGTLYAYSFGDCMNNTGMYKADGSVASSKALAKCIGLGNSNSAGIDVIAEYLTPGHPLYDKWIAGLPENTGVMFANISVAGKTKSAYLNTVSGIEASSEWNRMLVYYFETLEGVTDADVVGDEFGVYTDDCFTVDGVTDTSGYAYFVNASTSVVSNPVKNVVSKAKIEKSISLTEKGAQIRFDRNADGSYANTFDVRTRATIADADFNSLFSSNDDAETKIVKVGFVYADVAKALFSIDDAKAVAQGTAKEGYTNAPVDYIQDCDGYYMFTCLVEDVPQADISNPLTTYAYMGIDTNGDGTAEQWIFYTDATSVSFQTLYNTHYASAAAKYGW